MPGVINDPEAIKKFRYELTDVVEALRDQLRKTDAAIDEVAETWNDEQFRKFRDSFNDDKEVIEPLCRDVEDFESGPLYQLQTILESYIDL